MTLLQLPARTQVVRVRMLLLPPSTPQWLKWGLCPFVTFAALEEAEVIPGEHSDARRKPLTLTNGHGRHIAVTPERALASVEECPLNMHVAVKFLAVSLPKPPCNGRFNPETAGRRFQN
jgi:hypothetical protein